LQGAASRARHPTEVWGRSLTLIQSADMPRVHSPHALATHTRTTRRRCHASNLLLNVGGRSRVRGRTGSAHARRRRAVGAQRRGACAAQVFRAPHPGRGGAAADVPRHASALPAAERPRAHRASHKRRCVGAPACPSPRAPSVCPAEGEGEEQPVGWVGGWVLAGRREPWSDVHVSQVALDSSLAWRCR
jgi:hypothetical protein